MRKEPPLKANQETFAESVDIQFSTYRWPWLMGYRAEELGIKNDLPSKGKDEKGKEE